MQCLHGCRSLERTAVRQLEELAFRLNFLHLCPLDQNGHIPFHRRLDECGSEDVDACAHKRQELHNCYPKCLRLVKDFPNAFEDLTSAAEICQVDVDDTDIGRGSADIYLHFFKIG